ARLYRERQRSFGFESRNRLIRVKERRAGTAHTAAFPGCPRTRRERAIGQRPCRAAARPARAASPKEASMRFPEFFERAPVVRVRDPLAAMLGAPGDGVIEYRYADAVRL